MRLIYLNLCVYFTLIYVCLIDVHLCVYFTLISVFTLR